MTNYNDPDVNEFIIEANELLETAEYDLLMIEKNESASYYDSVFRALHSIKGGAGMLDMPELQAHMHKVENQWTNLKGKSRLEKYESEYFLAAIDVARKLLLGQKVTFDYGGPQKSEIRSPSNSFVPSQKKITKKTPDKGLIYAIDDEEQILEILKEILEDDGFRVVCFSDSKALIEKIFNSPPDLIITDFRMPLKTGVEILHEVREIQPDIPVIMLSAHLTKDVLMDSLHNGGFYGAIEKPFKPIDLLRECLTAIRHHEVKKMIRRSLNLLVYQFSDLEKFLISSGKGDIAKAIASELKILLAQQKALVNSGTVKNK